jgi:hypothetical protein
MRPYCRIALAIFVSLPAIDRSSAQGSHGSQSAAQAAAAYRGRLLGVFDAATGAPLADVTVTDLVTGMSARTTATGTLSLIYLPDGGSLVRVQKIGYEALSMVVPISPSDTAPLTLVMRRLAELPAVVSKAAAPQHISPGLRGFDERQRLGFAGYFIGDSILRGEENRRLADVLRMHAPSIMIYEGSGSSTLLLKSPRCAAGGPPQVYLDGIPLNAPPDAKPSGRIRRNAGATQPSSSRPLPFNLSDFQVSDFAGVEWYPDSDILPEEFDHTSLRCGALLLWTREK